MTADLAARDLVHMALGRGRDRAVPIGQLAESLHLLRREVEQAVQGLRLEGIAVCSGNDGVWLGDTNDLAATYRQLRGRVESQNRTCWALRATLRRLRAGEVHQERLPWDSAA